LKEWCLLLALPWDIVSSWKFRSSNHDMVLHPRG
jgi:hypothetical protein